MAKEILLYQPIYSFTASNFINELEANKGNDICIRMNCPGGDVMAGIGMIAKYSEHIGGKKVKVDGQAASMAAYFCAMSDDVECLDASQFLIHRAAFPRWVEDDKNIFTDDMKAMLKTHNDMLRAALERKIDAAKFKSVTGKTFDQVFSLDDRIDINLSAAQAQKLGLVSKVIPLNKAKKREINALASTAGIAAFYTEAEETTIITTNQNKMTVADVKANSEVFAAIKAEILEAEKDRISAFAEFKEIDPKACIDAIVNGDKFTHAFGAKMQVKAMSAQGIKNMQEAAPKAETADTTQAKTEEQQKMEASKAQLTSDLLSHFKVTAEA